MISNLEFNKEQCLTTFPSKWWARNDDVNKVTVHVRNN